MILVDSSIWVDHLRSGDKELARLLDTGQVLMHPFVIGEISLGHLGRKRNVILEELSGLPEAVVASDEEVHNFIDRHHLFGLGIGYVDVHLLASARITPDARLWTRDKRLHAATERVAFKGWKITN